MDKLHPVTPEQQTLICERIASGMSMRAICEMNDVPARSTVHEALAIDAKFADQYRRAREIQADLYAAEIIEIADDGTRDMRIDDEGNEVVDHDHIARSRLRVDARKWAASKLAPKKYGDKVELSGDAANPIALTGSLNINFVTPKERD